MKRKENLSVSSSGKHGMLTSSTKHAAKQMQIGAAISSSKSFYNEKKARKSCSLHF